MTPTPLFSLEIDPRRRLLLFDIADDPVYAAMEIQVFDDAAHGRGVLALLQRHDRTVDIHRQPTLRLERGPFSVGRGIGAWRTTTIEPARLELAPDGVVADVALTDADGRRIEVHIDDRDGIERRRSTLLAPVGSGVEHPEQFFVVLMREFDLGRTSGRKPSLTIAGERRTIKPFPGPARLHGRRFIRYSGDPVIAILNPAHDGAVDPASLGPMAAVTTGEGGASAALRFTPAFPAIGAMENGDRASGTWLLDVADEPGLTGGDWTVERTGDLVDVAMVVTRPWRPRGLPWSLRFVTTVARVFREWPTTYRWSAQVGLATDPPTLRSSWRRTTGPNAANAYRVPRLPKGPLLGGLAAGAAAAAVAVGILATRWAKRR